MSDMDLSIEANDLRLAAGVFALADKPMRAEQLIKAADLIDGLVAKFNAERRRADDLAGRNAILENLLRKAGEDLVQSETQAAAMRAALELARSAIDQLMGDTDLPEDDSQEMRAMQAIASALATDAGKALLDELAAARISGASHT